MSEQRSTKPSAGHPVCKAVREVRKSAGFTQVQLAEAVGLMQPYVSAWETIRVPTVDQIADLEAAMKAPAGTILRKAGYVLDTKLMSLEEFIALDSTISRDTRRVLVSVLEADRMREVRQVAPRRSRSAE